MRHTIESDVLQISATERGAEIKSVLLNGKQRVYQGGEEWDGSAPNLFPYCGRMVMCIDGKIYPRILHGFATRADYELVGKQKDSMTFVLKSGKKTKKYYPYDFEYYITFSVRGGELTITHRVKNTDDKPIYFALGGHESLILDDPIETYTLVFEKKEPLKCEISHLNKTLPGVDFGVTDELKMPADLLVESDTVMFDNVLSRKVALKDKNGETVYKMTFDGFSRLFLWRPIGENIICIEPWQNYSGGTAKNPRDFKTVQGVNELEPGKEITFTRTVEYLK